MCIHKKRTKANGKYIVNALIFSVAISSCQLLSGCSLLPEEKARPTLVVQNGEKIDYEVETVKREDLLKSKFIYSTYVQLSDESLIFELEGKLIEKVHVEIGTTVKKGDLLAQLDLGAAEDEMIHLGYVIEKEKIELFNLKEQKKIEEECEKRLYELEAMTLESYQDALRNIEKTYRERIYKLEDDIYLKELHMADYRELEKKSKLYAGMDGIVSMVKDKLEGSISNSKDTVIRIIDNTNCAFRVESEDFAHYFKEGDIYDIEMKLSGGDIHKGKVVLDKENPFVIYLELLEPNFNLSVGDRGTINLILEEKNDVLTVSTRALRKAENFHYVYYINEDGIRSMKEVTIGMTGNNTVEVTSGLEIGDIVITR